METRSSSRSRSGLRAQYRELLEKVGAEDLAAGLRRLQDQVRYGEAGETSSPILEEELRIIRNRAEQGRELEGRPRPDLLLSIVGYSPEPLLMALAFHAPRKIALLVPRDLTQEYLRSLRRLWRHYRECLEAPKFDDQSVLKKTVGDSPAEIFEAVRQLAGNRGADGPAVILDVTCAKKSMIAGAFAAAGFLGVETSYVDFESYDPVLRRPDPGSCRPMRLRHPYQLFRLKEQGRLEKAFDDRRFAEAQALAAELVEMASSPETQSVLGEGEAGRTAAKFERIETLAAAYSLWSEGFYRDAHEKLRGVEGVEEPETVEILARVWPRQQDEQEAILAALAEEKVFADPTTALAFFLDVLVWNDEAAVRSQPRAAFLRLYGAVESLIFFAFEAFGGSDARGLKVIYEDAAALKGLTAAFPRDRRDKRIDWQEELHRAAIGFFRISSLAALRVLARTSAPLIPQLDLPQLLGERAEGARPLIPRVRARIEPPPLARGLYNRLIHSKKGGLGRFSSLRNKVAHWMAPVPTESVLELRRYYLWAVGELVPRAVEQLRDRDVGQWHRLESWRDRLLAAARGEVCGSYQPLSYRQVLGREQIE